MRADSYLAHLRLMKTVRTLGPLQRLIWEQLLVMGWIWQAPYSSAADLQAHDLLTQQRTYDIINSLRDGGYVAASDLGGSRSRQRRYLPTLKGINFVRERLGWPLEWQVTQTGLERVSRYIPFLEPAYSLAPRLWRSSAAIGLRYDRSPDPNRADEIVFDESCRMYRFVWVRNHGLRGQNGVHSIARYVNEDGDEIAVPFVFFGSLHGPWNLGDMDKILQGLHVPGNSGGPHGGLTPPGVVFVCVDRLAALRVQRECHPSINKAVLTAQGEIIEVMRPLPPRGLFRMTDQPPGKLKNPDRVIQWLLESPHGQALDGVEKNRVFRRVEQYPGITISQLARGVRLRRNVVRRAVGRMIEHDLVRELEHGLYLGEVGIRFISQRDRESIKAARARFTKYAAADGRYRAQQRRHDRAVAEVGIAFEGAGFEVFTGRRMVLNHPGLTQIKPDLWVGLIGEDGDVIFVAVEVEFSAQDDGRITEKLTTYRLAKSEAGESCSVLFVTGTAEAADRCARLGDDLPMFAASYDEATKNSPRCSIWRWRGQRVPVSQMLTLSDQGTFIQRAGPKLEYRRPPQDGEFLDPNRWPHNPFPD